MINQGAFAAKFSFSSISHSRHYNSLDVHSLSISPSLSNTLPSTSQTPYNKAQKNRKEYGQKSDNNVSHMLTYDTN